MLLETLRRREGRLLCELCVSLALRYGWLVRMLGGIAQGRMDLEWQVEGELDDVEMGLGRSLGGPQQPRVETDDPHRWSFVLQRAEESTKGGIIRADSQANLLDLADSTGLIADWLDRLNRRAGIEGRVRNLAQDLAQWFLLWIGVQELADLVSLGPQQRVQAISLQLEIGILIGEHLEAVTFGEQFIAPEHQWPNHADENATEDPAEEDPHAEMEGCPMGGQERRERLVVGCVATASMWAATARLGIRHRGPRR